VSEDRGPEREVVPLPELPLAGRRRHQRCQNDRQLRGRCKPAWRSGTYLLSADCPGLLKAALKSKILRAVVYKDVDIVIAGDIVLDAFCPDDYSKKTSLVNTIC